MNLISDILFWISNGLLVPVVVLLIILFIRSLLLIGSFFGQYLAIRRTDALLRQQLDTLTIDTLSELEGKLPVSVSHPRSSAESVPCHTTLSDMRTHHRKALQSLHHCCPAA